MKEIINKLMSKENVHNGIQIALTIGLIGTMLGLMEYDQRVNGEHYTEQRQKTPRTLSSRSERMSFRYVFFTFSMVKEVGETLPV